MLQCRMQSLKCMSLLDWANGPFWTSIQCSQWLIKFIWEAHKRTWERQHYPQLWFPTTGILSHKASDNRYRTQVLWWVTIAQVQCSNQPDMLLSLYFISPPQFSISLHHHQPNTQCYVTTQHAQSSVDLCACKSSMHSPRKCASWALLLQLQKMHISMCTLFCIGKPWGNPEKCTIQLGVAVQPKHWVWGTSDWVGSL